MMNLFDDDSKDDDILLTTYSLDSDESSEDSHELVHFAMASVVAYINFHGTSVIREHTTGHHHFNT